MNDILQAPLQKSSTHKPVFGKYPLNQILRVQSDGYAWTKGVHTYSERVFKSYLISACRIIRKNDGVITAFDGDRVMAVFVGDYKNTSATLCALQINYAVLQILNPQLKKEYPKTAAGFQLKHAVGIDTGELFVARTGIRGANDLVWVGGPANFAAKMSSLREENYASWITDSVYKMINKSAKFSNDQNMWETRGWLGRTIYRSNWHWAP